MKIVTIIGARPQFIKAAVVSRAFAASKDVTEIIVHTGQHFDSNMSDIFFEEMCIPKPHYNLNINGLGHGAMTGQMLERIEEVLIETGLGVSVWRYKFYSCRCIGRKETSYQGGSCRSGTTFIQYGYAGRDKPYLDRPYQ